MCSRKVTNPVFSFLKSKRGLSQSSQTRPPPPMPLCKGSVVAWVEGQRRLPPSMAAGSLPAFVPQLLGAWGSLNPPSSAHAGARGAVGWSSSETWGIFPGHLVGREGGPTGWGTGVYGGHPEALGGRCPLLCLILQAHGGPVREGRERGLHFLLDSPRVLASPCPRPRLTLCSGCSGKWLRPFGTPDKVVCVQCRGRGCPMRVGGPKGVGAGAGRATCLCVLSLGSWGLQEQEDVERLGGASARSGRGIWEYPSDWQGVGELRVLDPLHNTGASRFRGEVACVECGGAHVRAS